MYQDRRLTKSYLISLTEYRNQFYLSKLYHKDLNVQLSAHLTLWLQQSNGQKRKYNPLISCHLGLFVWYL